MAPPPAVRFCVCAAIFTASFASRVGYLWCEENSRKTMGLKMMVALEKVESFFFIYGHFWYLCWISGCNSGVYGHFWYLYYILDFWCVPSLKRTASFLPPWNIRPFEPTGKFISLPTPAMASEPKCRSGRVFPHNFNWLVVSTPLKHISQNGNLPQIGIKIKHIWNHQPVNFWIPTFTCKLVFFQAFQDPRKNVSLPNVPTSLKTGCNKQAMEPMPFEVATKTGSE